MTKRKSITRKSSTKKRKVNTTSINLDSISQEQLGELAQLLIEEEYRRNKKNLFSGEDVTQSQQMQQTPPPSEQPLESEGNGGATGEGGGGISGAQAAQAASGAIQGTMGVISAVSDISKMKDTSGYENQVEGLQNQTFSAGSTDDLMNAYNNREQVEDIKFEEIAGTKAENRKTAGKAIGSGAAAGASVGSLFGPIGTLIGTAAGALIGGVSAWIGNSSKKARARKKQQELLAQKQAAENQQMANFTVGADNLQSDMAANTMANYAAYGGLFNQYKNGGPTKDNEEDYGLIEFEEDDFVPEETKIVASKPEEYKPIYITGTKVMPEEKTPEDWLLQRAAIYNKNYSDYVGKPVSMEESNLNLLEAIDRMKSTPATFMEPYYNTATKRDDWRVFKTTEDPNTAEGKRALSVASAAARRMQKNGMDAAYRPETKNIIYAEDPKLHPEMTPHERAHALLLKAAEATIANNKVKLRDGYTLDSDYTDSPEEIFARLMEARITKNLDPNKEYSAKELRKILKDDRSDLNRYTDDYLEFLFNKVAYNPSNIDVQVPEIIQGVNPNEGVSFAAHGGLLNKFNDGGFENMPQYITIPRDQGTISTAPTKAERAKTKFTNLGNAILNFTPFKDAVSRVKALQNAFEGDNSKLVDILEADTVDDAISKVTKRKSSGTLEMILNPGDAIANYHELQAALGHHSSMNTPEAIEQQRNELTWTNLIGGAYNKINKNAEGGPLFNEYSNGITIINEGGTHEENPYEGIQVGVDPQGTPNLVEEGEVIFNDYVFSNRIKVPESIRTKYKLRNKKDLTFADAAKEIQKESEEMPNDSIARRTMEVRMTELMQEQEMLRMRKQNKRNSYTKSREANIHAKGEKLKQWYDNNIKGNWGKMGNSALQAAPVFGSLLAVGNDIFGGNEPDYSQVEKYEKAINNAYQPVEAKTLSDYMEYNPYDTSLALNRLGATQAASRRAIMNTSAGNSAAARAAILASDYNYGNQIGDTYRTAREYNDAQREKVASFNRATNQYNATALDNAARFNAQLAANKADAIAKAGQWRDQIYQANRAEKSANLTGLYEGIAGLGQTSYNQGRTKMLQDNGIIASTDDAVVSKYGGRIKRNKKKRRLS